MTGPAAAPFGEALALLQLGRPGEAVFRLRAAFSLEPASADIAAALGFALGQLGRAQDAAACYRQALAFDPAHPAALCNLGELARGEGDFARARDLLSAAIAVRPDLAEAHSNLGLVLAAQGEITAAAAALERSVELRPEFADGWSNLANVLIEAGRPEDAISAGRRSARLAPGSAAAWWNLGLAERAAGRLVPAIASLRRALVLAPDNAMTHWNLALALLAAGVWREGWAEWEWRFAAGRARPLAPGVPVLTAGDCVEGKRIALYSEQGLGDTLQFLRYAWALSRAGACVDLAVQEPVARLLAACGTPFTRVRVNDGSAPPQPPDFQASLMSLAGIAGTRVSNVPPPLPVLEIPASVRARWHEWASKRSRPLVGFAWRGNPLHPADRFRSLSDDAAREIIRLLGDGYVSLQLDGGSPARDLVETAALIAELDQVISADTMIAHLAGLIGTPVRILLSAAPDWRWLTGREDSPWYPRARLIRQTRIGDWGPVIEDIRRSAVTA